MVSDRMCPAPPVVTEMDSVDCTLVMGHMGCTVQSPDNSFGGDITDACEKKNTETNHYEGASRFNLRNKLEEVINVVERVTNLSKKRNFEGILMVLLVLMVETLTPFLLYLRVSMMVLIYHL
jgi:hypothetical protein